MENQITMLRTLDSGDMKDKFEKIKDRKEQLKELRDKFEELVSEKPWVLQKISL
jgi:hypothetical protein